MLADAEQAPTQQEENTYSSSDDAETIYNDAIPMSSSHTQMSAMQISAKGTTVSYIDAYGWGSAPSCGAGLWYGSDSTTDGDLGFFIGHHPGNFAFVMDISVGDPIAVKDRYGNQHTYHASQVFNWSQSGYMEDVFSHIGSWGESIILQTCIGDNQNVRVVFAE